MNVMYYRVVNSGYGVQYLPCTASASIGQGAGTVGMSTGVTGMPSPSAPLAGATAPLASGLGACTPGVQAPTSKWLYNPAFSSSAAAFQYLFRPRLNTPRQNKAVRCETCNITLNSEQQAQQHYSGKNHLRKVRQASGADKDADGEGSPSPSPKTGKKRSSSSSEGDASAEDDDGGSSPKRLKVEGDNNDDDKSDDAKDSETDDVKPEEEKEETVEDPPEKETEMENEGEVTDEASDEECDSKSKDSEQPVPQSEPQPQTTASPPTVSVPPTPKSLPVPVPSSTCTSLRAPSSRASLTSISTSSLLGVPQPTPQTPALSSLNFHLPASAAKVPARPSFVLPQYRSVSLGSSLQSPQYLLPDQVQQQYGLLQPMYSAQAAMLDNNTDYINAMYTQQQTMKFNPMSYDYVQQQTHAQAPIATNTVYESLSLQLPTQDDPFAQNKAKMDPVSQAVYDNLVSSVSSDHSLRPSPSTEQRRSS